MTPRLHGLRPLPLRTAAAPRAWPGLRAWPAWLLPLAIATLGAALRWALLSGFRLHPDEALYATWARFIATGQDPLLAAHLVDKPPLFIYLLASLFSTLGASEEIARLPNQVASVAALLLTYAVALELYRSRRLALTAMSVLALSPLAILFAPTVFTDPLMTTLLLAVVWSALRGHWLSTGLLYGLALATKQDALFFLPLVPLLMLARRAAARQTPSHVPALRCSQRSNVPTFSRSNVLTFQRSNVPTFSRSNVLTFQRSNVPTRFLLGLAVPLLLVVLWSAARPQPDFLQASLANYGGLNFAPPDTYALRALEWLPLLRTLSSDWLLLGLLVASPLILLRERLRTDAAVLAVAFGWLLLHILFIIPAWDRYVLPLAPVCALLLARMLTWAYDLLPAGSIRMGAFALVALLLLLPAQSAMQNEIHVGRDFGLHAGVDQVGQWFWHIDTTATIVYDHDLSWELDYYTFGRGLDRRWFAGGEQLAQDAAHMPLAHRFVVVAEWEGLYPELDRALAAEHLMLAPVFVARRPDGSEAITVYMVLARSELGHLRN